MGYLDRFLGGEGRRVKRDESETSQPAPPDSGLADLAVERPSPSSASPPAAGAVPSAAGGSPDPGAPTTPQGVPGMPNEDEVRQVNEYMMEKMGHIPDMFKTLNTVVTEPGKTFADFYNSLWQDGALSRKHKELIMAAVGVAYCSPDTVRHVIPALRAKATMPEIFEAVSIGMVAAGFVPGGPGMPYAFKYATKALDIADKYLKGEPWDDMPEPKWDHGVY